MPQKLHPLAQQTQALIEGESNVIANLANIAALLKQMLEDINWVGFYLYDEARDQLVLGPFQGKPACIRIDRGRGVCGKAFDDQTIQRIDDVHQFPGHIVCDAASQSEMVLPFKLNATYRGVLDLDAPILHRFQQQDQDLLSQVIQVLEEQYHSEFLE